MTIDPSTELDPYEHRGQHPDVCAICHPAAVIGRLFTFGLVYEHPADGEGDAWCEVEELDVHAPDAVTARAEAERQAAEDYAPGWARIEELAPGGSGGLVTVWR